MPDNQNSATPAPVPNETNTVDIISEVVSKINDADNILVALSSNPSVDEMAAAIGLSLFLDKLGKRTTAIYSGNTPNALEFLKPEETFESTADTLQDFVIALNKEKADHLRYKLDGDFVKIFITPYRTRISEDDLDFSYGDFNVDLVLALDVANGVDLDSALREHGRIMHDAVIINITTSNPGKLGEIQWSDKSASSISEMIARLLYKISDKVKIEKEEATAFLTGIVAATNRFSNAKTTSDTMKISSRLMESGANQQLVAKNITPDTENELFSISSDSDTKFNEDKSKLSIKHGSEEGADEVKEIDTNTVDKEATLLDDLKIAEANLSQAGAETTPELINTPIKIDNNEPNNSSPNENESNVANEAVASANIEPSTTAMDASFIDDKPEKILQPTGELTSNSVDSGTNNYGQMLEDALSNVASTTPSSSVSNNASVHTNPATLNAPTVPTNPEINGVPQINYMPMPGDEVLPPPPTPPIPSISSDTVPTTAPSLTELKTPIISTETPTTPQPVDASSFKIPGM